MDSKNWLYVLIGILIAIMIGGVIYFFVKTGALNDQILEEKRKAKYWNDSLRVTQTDLGNVYEKYATEVRLKDATIMQLDLKLKIALSLYSQALVFVNSKQDTLFAVHTPVYADSGAEVFLTDSVWFVKENDKWKSEQKANVMISLSLDQTIGRDSTGNFYGSVETKSDKIFITSLNTFVNDLYNPPKLDDKPLNSIYSNKVFGIRFDADSRAVAGNLMLNLGNYQISTGYMIFSKDITSDAKFYERLRLGVGYYIF
jgi:hypothetical protein